MEKLNRRIDIQTCREHHEVIRILLELFPTAVPFDSRAVFALLPRLTRVLVGHLKLEDDRLYPTLEASSERDLRDTAIRYRLEMGGLRERFDLFLSTWKSADEIEKNQEQFMAEWSESRKALEVRMAKEDHGLYAIAEDYLSRDDIA